ncbi:MAG: cbb3-type cytochrome c oxidase subunit I, partial [Abditibacteriaceae bacterium]
MRYKRLWLALGFVVVASFAVLGFYGWRLYQVAPQVPQRVITTNGKVLFTGQEIKNGQNVWQSMGGQEVGSIWGHGAYLAPDWSADWVHREAVWLLNKWSQEKYHQNYSSLDAVRQAEMKAILHQELRANTYNPTTGDLVISPDRAAAIKAISAYYSDLFGTDPAFKKLRDDYSIPRNAIPSAEHRQEMNGFFFWTAWACVTNRPGETNLTYTSNWPHEPLVGNILTGDMVLWSVLSFVFLLAGIGALTWHYVSVGRDDEEPEQYPEDDPLLAAQPTPSMKATLKYFWLVGAMFVVQIIMGVFTAHYTVEGNSFFGLPLAQWLPYAVTRTWHLQLGIFWIATSWLATGLFMAPAVSGREPKYQKLGVNVLFVCLIVIVAGSMCGEWLTIQQKLGFKYNFWFGSQGLEYVDLGRFWQIFLLVGLCLWLGLLTRALMPALRKGEENKHLLGLFLLSSAAITLFWGAGLMWGQQSN